jgi:hypothetical protein
MEQADMALAFWTYLVSSRSPKGPGRRTPTICCIKAMREGAGMDWDDYLRDQAAHYRQLAESAEDPLIKQEHLELAAICEEVANHIEDRLPGG